MKIAMICHYFMPEIGAPSARIHEMAKCWVNDGHEVQVITCFPNHPTGVIPERYKGLKYLKEEVDGIIVHRNWVYATPNKGFVKKTLGHISFMISSVLFTLQKLGNTDVIITSSPTFFSIFSGYLFSRIKKVPFILEIRDLWPAAIVELGVLKNRFIIRLLEKIELYYYKKSTRLVMVTASFKQNLISRGINSNKIDIITNGYDEQLYYIRKRNDEIIHKYGLNDKFIVEYIGAHGLSQALDKIIYAAAELRHDKDIQFVFVGEGAEKEKLVALAKEMGLSNVLFVDAQPKDRIPEFYSVADVCLIPLKRLELFKTFIPSKIFEIMGCGVPIIASLEGETAEILSESGSAIITPPEDIYAIKDAILLLKGNENLRKQLRDSAIGYVKENYTRQKLAEKYISVIEKTLEEFG